MTSLIKAADALADASALAKRLTAYRQARESADGVKVKPLVWDDNKAQTIVGTYTYGVIGRCWYVYLNGCEFRDGDATTFDDAIRAAQAAIEVNYEARIKAALEETK